MNIKKLFLNTRVIILIVFILFAFLAISPGEQDGLAIRGVAKDSAAHEAGLVGPKKNTQLSNYERVLSINGERVDSEEAYFSTISDLPINTSVRIKTDQSTYVLITREVMEAQQTGNTIEITEETWITEGNESYFGNVTRLVNETVLVGTGATEALGLTVAPPASSNLRKGLDLAGGVRLLLQPEEEIPSEMVDRLIDALEQRINAFGLSDVVIKASSDLSGNTFILVEIAGLQQTEVEQLIGQQGKFEARIGDQLVFTGGDHVRYVCRTADCSGLDPQQGCSGDIGDYACRFFFTIDLSPAAAQRQADLTQDLTVNFSNGQQYLSEPLDLYLDDELTDSLQIAASLRGRAETRIQISGSGQGTSIEAAEQDALKNMRTLQTILETGSLPVKLDIVKADHLSPVLGKTFLRSALLTGLVALLAVGVVVFVRYRTLKVVFPMVFTLACEVFLLLGGAAFFKVNLDLAAIAGIIIVIGTGVDHQIVIADELFRKKEQGSWKQKVKSAFFIIMAAYFTTLVAMIPLVFAGAGMLRGFALTTMLGVTIGVLITRPAYASILEHLQ